MSAPLLRRETVVAGVRLSYLEREPLGETAKAPLLMLHGLVASAESFGMLIAEIPGDRRIVALDLLGTSVDERGDPPDVSFAGLAKQVQAFAAAIGALRPILVGHSHGGAVSLEIAATQPDFAGGLVLLCPAHPFSGHEERLVKLYLSVPKRVLARLLPLTPRWVHRLAFRRMLGPRSEVADERVELYRQPLRKTATVASLLRLLGSWQQDMLALRKRLSARPLSTPTLLLWGDLDGAVPLHTAAALERQLLRCEHVTLAGVGHLPNEEAPEECGRVIRNWLQRLETEPTDG